MARTTAPMTATIAPTPTSHGARSRPAKPAIAVATARKLTSTASRRAHASNVAGQRTPGQYKLARHGEHVIRDESTDSIAVLHHGRRAGRCRSP